MSYFTSSREKRLWLYALIVLFVIISTLIFGQPLIGIFGNQNIQAVIFMVGMLLVGSTILVHGVKLRPRKTEISIWLGFSAVYLMLILRLGLPERSHMMEYSVLAIFIHMALMERVNQGKKVPMPALIAIVVTILIGVIDECIQIFLPERVFDPNDIIFNSFVAVMAIGSRIVLQWVRKRFSKK